VPKVKAVGSVKILLLGAWFGKDFASGGVNRVSQITSINVAAVSYILFVP